MQPITNIKNLIPQKEPFVMVDVLLFYSKTKLISSFTILENNLFFENDTLLESGIIENMAQTVALHTGYDYFLRGKGIPTGYIGSIKNVEIIMLPVLNQIITTEIKILHEFMGVFLVDIMVLNEKKEIIASCQMKTVIPN
jgi:predicted hotdog family 3-hydroxylacyl-ACP dehydratase